MSKPTEPLAQDAPTRLRRALGPLELTASGVGIIIGAGIYVLLGPATAEAGVQDRTAGYSEALGTLSLVEKIEVL